MTTNSGPLMKLADLPVGANKAFLIDGRSILLCHSTAGVFALENKCTHQFAPLEGGRIRGHFLFCPKHGQRFDLRDGSTGGPLTKVAVPTFAVTVDDNDTLAVTLPQT